MMKTGAKAYIFIFKYYGLVGHISDAKINILLDNTLVFGEAYR